MSRATRTFLRGGNGAEGWANSTLLFGSSRRCRDQDLATAASSTSRAHPRRRSSGLTGGGATSKFGVTECVICESARLLAQRLYSNAAQTGLVVGIGVAFALRYIHSRNVHIQTRIWAVQPVLHLLEEWKSTSVPKTRVRESHSIR